MYIIDLTYVKPIEEADRHMQAHADFLNRYYESGHFILSGRKIPRTGGLILALFPSPEAVHQAISQDPFFQQGIATYTITEIEPTNSVSLLKPLLGI